MTAIQHTHVNTLVTRLLGQALEGAVAVDGGLCL
jgi:hypothetical protein